MLAIAVGGPASSTSSPRGSCSATRRESLNVSAALRHVIADLLGSVGVIVAAVVILATGWEYADPAVGVLIGAARARQLVGDPARLGPDPARGLAAGHRRRGGRPGDGGDRRASTRSTTCTCGRSPPASRRSPRTCSSPARPTATRPAASSSRCSHERFGLDHTTLQVDHEGGELLQIENAIVSLRRDGYEISDDRVAASTSTRSGASCARPTGRRTCRARSSSGRSPARCASASTRRTAPRRGSRGRSPTGPTFAWIADVFVLEQHRGRGLGVWLVESVLDAPGPAGTLRRRSCSRPRDAHGLYERFGFEPSASPAWHGSGAVGWSEQAPRTSALGARPRG